MEALGGERRGPVMAITPHSLSVAEAEHYLLWQAVVAVVVGTFPPLLLVNVKRTFALRFHAAEDGISVAWKGHGTLIIRFTDPIMRARVLAVQWPLVLGHVSFNILPWTRWP